MCNNCLLSITELKFRGSDCTSNQIKTSDSSTPTSTTSVLGCHTSWAEPIVPVPEVSRRSNRRGRNKNDHNLDNSLASLFGCVEITQMIFSGNQAVASLGRVSSDDPQPLQQLHSFMLNLNLSNLSVQEELRLAIKVGRLDASHAHMKGPFNAFDTKHLVKFLV
ncbi:unnamed protein product [Protopolystoma xenopodis]|uniref:Uncharacterized protein n=1 Tax=Protopolystoma xenopodis TaxID=117903 RepID=A0A448X2C5_9PLAT|nr:unnamed protein product [Protopolystoma xenopodis]